ncbi:hypothetical protein [Roseateles saccharophilus]|uniref:Uncharacterized protein n=1 Tax=Roseateles saccharophilus TaxID=304 RepID=A0A4R3UGG6_ROSSA|nr:hypothetical protein [Roseateles saccharophilus]MDG0834224.1 hypothetical protein [Roseateles saccharophilus]TCU89914.1 hypothetical protein EV671_103118 [Roseateles saccharophilus]
MAAGNTFAHADLLACVTQSLCTRTLNVFAQESRLDGESLKDAVDRYEVDYAWHVLGSDRMRNETVALLEAKLKQPATDAQKTCVAEVLRTAAEGQSFDLLMSFDSDVPELLAAMLHAQFAARAMPEAEAVS